MFQFPIRGSKARIPIIVRPETGFSFPLGVVSGKILASVITSYMFQFPIRGSKAPV